jgi:hypothetical protein
MLFYNARSCYPGGLVDRVTDSGGGLQGSYPHFGTSHKSKVHGPLMHSVH